MGWSFGTVRIAQDLPRAVCLVSTHSLILLSHLLRSKNRCLRVNTNELSMRSYVSFAGQQRKEGERLLPLNAFW